MQPEPIRSLTKRERFCDNLPSKRSSRASLRSMTRLCGTHPAHCRTYRQQLRRVGPVCVIRAHLGVHDGTVRTDDIAGRHWQSPAWLAVNNREIDLEAI